MGTFLFRKAFNKDQYSFEFFWTLRNLFANLE